MKPYYYRSTGRDFWYQDTEVFCHIYVIHEYIYIYIYIYQQREQEDTKSEYFALTYSISSYDVWTHNIYLQNPEAPFISTRTVFFLIKTENLERKAKKGPSVLTALGIDNMYIYISCSWNVHDCTVHSIISPNSS